MTSTSLINRVVIAGKAVDDPVTKRLTTRNGDTTKTTFVLMTPSGPREPSVRIEIEAWSNTATVAQRVAKYRRVIVDGHLIMSSFTDRNDQTQRRYAIRADSISFLDGPEDRDA